MTFHEETFYTTIHILSLTYIYSIETQSCIIQSLNCLFYLENRTIISRLYTPSGFLLVVVLDKVRVKLIKF
jgi:hypothetical protein